MPRSTTDEGDKSLEAAHESRFSSQNHLYYEEDDDDDYELIELERRLNDEVDEDFFTEPKRFNTIHRVIDVLGLQMIDDATVQSNHNDLFRNPVYRNLKAQQQIVEGAIEHMAVIHCADLNGSVIQVGKVARQFRDAVNHVRNLRNQVRGLQDTLGASTTAAPRPTSRPQHAMSLRELWLQKLECEAKLSLLGKLDIIRAAPARFDQYVSQTPCRIGAAVHLVATALQTMFLDNVSQVQALHKIMEQLMIRKQKAEDIVWETLGDILYLRTGNLPPKRDENDRTRRQGAHSGVTTTSAASTGNASAAIKQAFPVVINGIFHPFGSLDFIHKDDSDDRSTSSQSSDASLLSLESDTEVVASGSASVVSTPSVSSTLRKKSARNMMIPIPVLESVLDVEADERRCMEEIVLSMATIAPKVRQRNLPRYAEHVLALRIMVECLTMLKRLDDVERILLESTKHEIKAIVSDQQARTFAKLEHRQQPQSIRSQKTSDLSDFRRHLTCLLTSFGSVYIRLCHLAQIIRFKVTSDPELLPSDSSPASALSSVLTQTFDMMQYEVKQFLEACFYESALPRSAALDGAVNHGSTIHETGLFSLGIVTTKNDVSRRAVSTATKSNVMEMTTAKFVTSVLFSKSKTEPQVRHALAFRQNVDRWSSTCNTARLELAKTSGEDTSVASFKSVAEPVLTYLDKTIQNDLLPVLQEEAVNGTVKGLERRDAFDPVLDRTLYARPSSNDPQDVDMCLACQSMFKYTGPLFLALHKLPRDGDMYLPLVAVLEHVVLTFISRIKQQVASICQGKTAFVLLMQEAGGENLPSFSSIAERRRPFRLLLKGYGDSSRTEDIVTPILGNTVAPLPPSPSDTMPHKDDIREADMVGDITDGIEGEEAILQFELSFMKQFLDFATESKRLVVASDEEVMRAACLAHSLLKLAGLLENRLQVQASNGRRRPLTSTRALREAIKTIKSNGIKLAKFCRLDMLMQTLLRLSRVCRSSTLVAQDAVRIPSCVNDLGEYLTGASENLREAAGSAVSAYTFSSLEQYIPFFLMQSVRTVAQGKGIVTKSPLTINGIESLDRSGSVLYRDLKGATGFDNSFWDVELAAASFEHSAGFMAMLELDMDELVAYYMANSEDYTEEDFELMFSMNAPRRRGNVSRFHMAKRQAKK